MSMPEAQTTVRQLTLGEAVREALSEELRRDPTVLILGEDIAEAGTAFKVLTGMVDEFVGRILKASDFLHGPIHSEPLLDFNIGVGTCRFCHSVTPDILCNALKTTAKSWSAKPMPLATVIKSFAAVVVA